MNFTITKAQVSRAIQSELLARGMTKRSSSVYTTSESDELWGWAGIPIATGWKQSAIDVTPNVGLIYLPLERFIADLSGSPLDEVPQPTVSRHVGYLMPGRKAEAWLFSNQEDLQKLAPSLANIVVEHVHKFATSHGSLGSLITLLEENGPAIDPSRRPYQLTAALAMSQRLKEAQLLILSLGKEREDDEDLDQFLSRLEARIK